jgi:hypothetical protein
MSEWLSPTLEFVLLGLKVTGIIGAFVGFSPEKLAEKPVSENSKLRTARRLNRRAIATAFLSVAIGAEFVDSLLKRLDSKEQAERFDRLAHPLGTIRVSAEYSVSFLGSEVGDFKRRLDETSGKAVPDRERDRAAYTLYTIAPRISVSLNRADKPREDAETEATGRRSIDIGDIHWVPDVDDMQFFLNVNHDMALENIANERHYRYGNGVIFASLRDVANLPDDRDSNGSIISVRDLMGAKLQVTFCTAEFKLDSHINRMFKLQNISIEFPGRRTVVLSPDSEDVKWEGESQTNTPCEWITYTLPKTRAAWEKLGPQF